MGDLRQSLKRLLSRSVDELSHDQAMELAVQLGKGARWLLKPEYLEKAKTAARSMGYSEGQIRGWQVPPSLPDAPGACWVVAVTQQPKFKALREGVVVPLRWEKGSYQDDSQLPEGLLKTAQSVIQALKLSGEIREDQQWNLVPAEECLFTDLGRILFEGKYASGWVSLAAGLLLAAGNGRPRPDVWATGCWNFETGVAAVDGLEEKLKTAAEYKVRRFFVPASCLKKARQIVDQLRLPLQIESLADSIKPRAALAQYLSSLAVRAERHAPPEARTATYMFINDQQESTEYYLDSIIDELADKVRQKIDPPEFRKCRYLITTVSDSYEIVCLSHLVFRPESSLIVFTQSKADRYQPLAEKAKEWLKGKNFDVQVRPLKSDSSRPLELVSEYQACVQELLGQDRDGPLVIDITPGTKLMSVAWAYAAPRTARLVYYESEFDAAKRKPKPFSEKPSVISVQELLRNT